MEPAILKLEDVGKIYDGVVAVEGVNFEADAGQSVVLIGTSGSGKTTTLKMINRLIEPSSGKISIDGQDVMTQDVIRLRRSLGYVVQRGGLFPHMTVAENVGLPNKLEGWEKDRTQKRVQELLEMVNLPADKYARRYPDELSGGQQQRIGVARALALDPKYLLMDEPFGALDPITRNQIQDEFVRLIRQMGKTVVLVTHDMEEAFKLGDRVVVMDKGKVVQQGTPEEIRENPATDFVRVLVRGTAAH